VCTVLQKAHADVIRAVFFHDELFLLERAEIAVDGAFRDGEMSGEFRHAGAI
jgi:hypothetical protein